MPPRRYIARQGRSDSVTGTWTIWPSRYTVRSIVWPGRVLIASQPIIWSKSRTGSPSMAMITSMLLTPIVRRPPDAAGVPIVAVTANAFEDQRAAYLDAGMADVLSKPIDLAALDAVIARHGRRAGGASPGSVSAAS